MDKQEVKEFILGAIREKLILFGVKETEVNEGFDLVKSGLLDSMAFVDLVADIEERFSIEIDFEKVADEPAFTSMGGLVKIILNA
ncbi:MAG: acyl carrier protein [Bacteroidales bacterium]|jgi:acyl carrier protein|nr:acyl carrier protein [Bacteroidales bacterium]